MARAIDGAWCCIIPVATPVHAHITLVPQAHLLSALHHGRWGLLCRVQLAVNLHCIVHHVGLLQEFQFGAFQVLFDVDVAVAEKLEQGKHQVPVQALGQLECQVILCQVFWAAVNHIVRCDVDGLFGVCIG